jgi:hypothetical protein
MSGASPEAAPAPPEAAAAPAAPKRKLSRKAQLKELAKRKKERCDPDFEPDPPHVEDAEVDPDEEMMDLPVEQPGEASKRAEEARKKRRQRLRGLSNEARFTAAWLASAPENQQHFVDKANRELAAEVASRAVAAAIKADEEERAREMRAQAAAREAERRKQRREQECASTPEVRNVRSRLGSSPFTASEPNSKSQRVTEDREALTGDMIAALARIYKQKHLRREDVVGGNKLSRGEWEAVRRDPKELQRMYALHIYQQARNEGFDWMTPPLGPYPKGRSSRVHCGGDTRGWSVFFTREAFIQQRAISKAHAPTKKRTTTTTNAVVNACSPPSLILAVSAQLYNMP